MQPGGQTLAGALGGLWRLVELFGPPGLEPGWRFVWRAESCTRQAGLKTFPLDGRVTGPGFVAQVAREVELRRHLDAFGTPYCDVVTELLDYSLGPANAWVAVQYYADGDLGTAYNRRPDLRRRLSRPAAALEFLARVADHLDFLHQRGVYHGDVRPANILLSITRREVLPVLNDLGSGGLLNPPPSSSPSGRPGPAAASPADPPAEPSVAEVLERAEDEQPRPDEGARAVAGRRADIRAVGLLLYQLRRERFDQGELPSQWEEGIPEGPIRNVIADIEAHPNRTAGELAPLLRVAQRDIRILNLIRRARTIGLFLLVVCGALVYGNLQQRQAKKVQQQAAVQIRDAFDTLTDDVVERWLGGREELDEVEKAYLRTLLAFHEEFARTAGDSPETRAARAGGSFRVGQIQAKLGQLADAEANHRRAQALLRPLAAEHPDRPEYRRLLAASLNGLGQVLRDDGRRAEAEPAFVEAVEGFGRLAAESPTAPAYRRDLAAALSNLARWRYERVRGEGVPEFERALEIRRGLAAEFPGSPDLQRDLGDSHHNLGIAHGYLRSFEKATGHYREAVRLYGDLERLSPSNPEFRYARAMSENLLGTMPPPHVPPEKKGPLTESALATARELFERYPGVKPYRALLLMCLLNRSALLLAEGRGEVAAPLLNEAIPEARREVADHPDSADARNRLAGVLINRAAAHSQAKDWTKARECLEEALPQQQRALKDAPKNHEFQRFYINNRFLTAEVCLALGDYLAAARAAEGLAASKLDPADCAFTAAMLWARAVPVVEADVSLPPEWRSVLAAVYAERAVQLVRQAVESGFAGLAKFGQHRAFQSIRHRPDFQNLVKPK